MTPQLRTLPSRAILATYLATLIAGGRIALGQAGGKETPFVSKSGHAARVDEAHRQLEETKADLAPKADDFRKKDDDLKSFVRANPLIRSSADEERLRELKAERDRAAREATEETLRKVEAEKRLRRAVQDQARAEPEATPAVAAIVKNVPRSTLPKPGNLGNLQFKVDDDYARANAINRVLQTGKDAQPIPLEHLRYATRPADVIDPAEVLGRDYQQMYDSAPRTPIPIVAQPHRQPGGRVPVVPPAGTVDVRPPQPGPVRLAGTSWSGSNGGTYSFGADGTLVETLGGVSRSASWRQAGDGATATWEKNYGPAVQRRDYRVVVSGDRAILTVTESWTPQVDTPATPVTVELRLR